MQLAQQGVAIPTGLGEHPGMLGSDDEDAVEADHEFGVVRGAKACCEGVRQLVGGPGQLIDDDPGAFAGEHGDGIDVGREAAADRQRRERRADLVLGEAEAELAGVAVRGTIDLAGSAATHVAHDQLHSSADGHVGAISLPEDVDPTVHPDGPGAWAVADQDRPDRHRRGQHTVDVELVGAHRLQCSDHPWHELGPAPGHHRVDRDLLDGHLHEVRRYHGDDRVGRQRGAVQHLQYALDCWWRDRQTICHATIEQHLHLVVEVGQFDHARPKYAATEHGAERIGKVRVHAHRSAAGPHHGQVATEVMHAGEALPVGTQPTDGPFHLATAGHAYQGRHCFDVVVPADREIRIVHRIDVLGERRVVLGVDGDVEVAQQRSDHLARLAVPLDEHDQSIRQNWPLSTQSRTLGHWRKRSAMRRTSRCLDFSFRRTPRNVPTLRIPR